MKPGKFIFPFFILAILAACNTQPTMNGYWRITQFGSSIEDTSHPNYYLDLAENHTFLGQVSDSNGNLTNYYSGNWVIYGNDVLKLSWSTGYCHEYTIQNLTDVSVNFTEVIGSCNDMIFTTNPISKLERQ